MANNPEEEAKAARAEVRFEKQQQRSREVEQIHAENSAKARAVDAKTVRLKGLRLAKEAADRQGQPEGGHARKGR